LIKWYENDGSNPINWIEHIVDNTISYPVTVCIADIDNDDDMDIVACESDFGEIVWYENIGGTPINWKRHIIDINGSGGAFVVDVGDIDGDDYLDVAVTGYHQNNVYWCKNNLPDTVWTKHIVDDSFGDALDVRIADVDLDFDLDLLVTGRIANAVVWYENDLPNTTWAMNCIDCSFVGANSVAAYDLDGDNDLDAVAGSWSETNGIINWYENPKITDVKYEANVIPDEYSLAQNYPNPFNPTTAIKYQISELSFVTLKVYDVLGNEIAALVNEEKTAGSYEVDFNAKSLTSGVYFYRLQAGSFVETKKMVLLR
jgi:hypothetical protein